MNPLICLEGVDAVGKTEVSKKLALELGYQYYKSPGGCFAQVRSIVDKDVDPFTRYFFYRAATQHDSRQIAALLEQSGVVCDRYIYSTIAMHAAMDARILSLFETTDLLIPTHAFVLTAREEVRAKRLSVRASVQDLERDLDLQRKADQIFKTLCPRVIDTSDNTVEQTTDAILSEIASKKDHNARS